MPRTSWFILLVMVTAFTLLACNSDGLTAPGDPPEARVDTVRVTDTVIEVDTLIQHDTIPGPQLPVGVWCVSVDSTVAAVPAGTDQPLWKCPRVEGGG